MKPRPFRRGVKVQADGGTCQPLRRERHLKSAKIVTVCLDNEGKDAHGRYHGRTGIPLFAILYPDGELVFVRFKRMRDFLLRLKRLYPKADIKMGNVKGLNPHWGRVWALWPDRLKQLNLFTGELSTKD